LEKWREDAERREKEFARERRKERSLHAQEEREAFITKSEADAVQRANANAQSWEWIDQRIAEALEHHDALIGEAIGESIADALREERQAIEAEFKTKLLELRTDLIERVIGALEAVTKIGRATAAAYDQRERKEFQFAREKTDEVIDLPNPLSLRRDIN
jgi:hypothetical protein